MRVGQYVALSDRKCDRRKDFQGMDYRACHSRDLNDNAHVKDMGAVIYCKHYMLVKLSNKLRKIRSS